ncbi:MAG: LysM peptidoglycan-binding domain-containing protein [Treponema sp.]|jgi:LysM repeat protein|nr:LysM peptidoglycan-binding domain-containing protein [Treponema sp.]
METGVKNFWLIDIFVVVFFLSTAAAGLYLFRLDLFRTLEARDEEPAGIIIIRNNVVQRRYADRTIWDRLIVDSPVYSGDLIRAADLSDATIDVEENQIGLNENTLIRIQHDPEGRGPFQIELKEGNLNVTTVAGGSGLMLNLMGRQVQAAPGAVLNAEMGEEGLIVQVNEGSATFIEEGKTRELSEGTMIAQDTNGVERIIPAAVVMRPQANARYLKNKPEPFPVNFSWRRINLEAGEPMRLELAGDPNFTRNFKVIEGLDTQVLANFDTGLWYWRLAYEDVVLSAGRFTIADATGPNLQSPVAGSVFRYYRELPKLRFQWAQKPGASHYIIEIGEAADFINPSISRQLSAASFIRSDLGPGTWYWRVRPVFSSAYEGSSDYSPAASFRIEQTNDPQAPAIEVPMLAAMPPVQIVQAVQVVQPIQTEDAAAAIEPPVLAVIPPIQAVPARTSTGTPAPGQYYTVRRGDVLHEIARQAYGNAALWTKIVEANNIPNPNLIEINDLFFIPE